MQNAEKDKDLLGHNLGLPIKSKERQGTPKGGGAHDKVFGHPKFDS